MLQLLQNSNNNSNVADRAVAAHHNAAPASIAPAASPHSSHSNQKRAVKRCLGALGRLRRRRRVSADAGAGVVDNHQNAGSTEEDASMPFWSGGLPVVPLQQQPGLFTAGAPAWLVQPLRQLLLGQSDDQQQTGAADNTAADTHFSSNRASRRRERRAARQQRRINKCLQQELKKASKQSKRGSSSNNSGARSTVANPTSSFSSSSLAPVSSTANVASASGGGGGGGFSTQVLAHMINPANCFPMLLHSAQHLLHLQQQQHHHQGSSPEQQQQKDEQGFGSSSITRRPQQLLTVGCRHWGNWWDGRGLLRVKIYDFAVYVDAKQAQAYLPTTPLLLEEGPGSRSSSRQQQQQEQQQVVAHSQQQQQAGAGGADLPALLKSSSTQVDMSLVLKAARDVPLHLLSAEYEKVLRRRLDRVGGSHSDVTALKQLLASFSDAERLPPAVTAGGSSNSSNSSSTEASELPATASGSGGGGSGSVRKGAMIVFERSTAGDVTARVGPVILGTVSSPKVAEALFDLYLGDQPVSKSAKDAAAQTLQRIAAAAAAAGPDHHSPQQAVNNSGSRKLLQQQQQPQPAQVATHYLPTSRGHEIKCEGGMAAAMESSGRAGKKGGGGVQGLGDVELDACVLHMG